MTRSTLYVVIGSQMDYGDSRDEIIGVFDDERMANDASEKAGAAFDSTPIYRVALNSVTLEAARMIEHYQKHIAHKVEHKPSCPSRVERHIPCTCGAKS